MVHPVELSNTDTITETMQEKYYKVNLKSFDGLMKHLRMAEYNVYTDGSCGAGYSIYWYRTQIGSNCANLPTTATVFQAEIVGIKLACEGMIALSRETTVKYVKFFRTHRLR